MRRIIPAFCAVVMLTAFTAPALSAEARIGGFPFSCTTPDGKTLQPMHATFRA